MKRLQFSALCLLLIFSSCVTLKPYQKQYVNDPEMQMGNDTGQQIKSYVQSIREGATISDGTNASGGCGCN